MKQIDVNSVISAHARKTKRMKVFEIMPSILQMRDARVPMEVIANAVSESIGESISANYVYILSQEALKKKAQDHASNGAA